MAKGVHTWQEILSQPQTWRDTLTDFVVGQAALQRFLSQTAFERILVVGCGSTYYLAQTAAATLAHCTGIPARAIPSSELWLFADTVAGDQALLLAISRSGTTTETLRALERFRNDNARPVVAITCYPQSPLARQADLTLAAPTAQERSVAQTRSFTSMLLLAQALTATLARDDQRLTRLQRLPTALEDLTIRLGNLPERLAERQDIQHFFFLGGGPLYGLANEAMLKTKEMSLSHAEAYHPLEFRHGPMSMVDQHTLVVGLLSDTGLAQERRVLQQMQTLGARTLALTEDGSALADWRADYIIELRSGLDEWERGPLYLPALQYLAYHRAAVRGLDPDQPHNLEAVVKL